jgi:FAD/FMN-containing dehydrogenase
MTPVLKNNAGYDLKHLFIGSEGTLGIVTRAVLRLQPLPVSRTTAFAAVAQFTDLPRLLRYLGANLGGTLSSFEVMWNNFYRLVTTPPARTPPPLPQSHPYYVLIEALGSNQEKDQERFESVLSGALEQRMIADCAIAMSSKERDQLWATRDDVEQMHQYRPVFLYDISLPIAHMEAYIAEVTGRLDKAWPGNRQLVFGHLGDGNLHVVVSVGRDTPEARHSVEEIVYGALRNRRGSVSAEHGIGLEKREYLSWCRSDAEIETMRAIKRALDPKGILNPGKIFEKA